MIDCKKLKEILDKKQNIVFLTGAGVSYLSGIPTYRGVTKANLFTFGDSSYEHKEIDNFRFMKEKPQVFNAKYSEFIDLIRGSQPNISHQTIMRLHKHYSG